MPLIQSEYAATTVPPPLPKLGAEPNVNVLIPASSKFTEIFIPLKGRSISEIAWLVNIGVVRPGACVWFPCRIEVQFDQYAVRIMDE